jgi:hypothetical protein
MGSPLFKRNIETFAESIDGGREQKSRLLHRLLQELILKVEILNKLK